MSKEYIDWEHYQKVFNEFCRHLRFVLPMMFFGTTYVFYRLTQDFAWCEDAVNQAPDVDKRETLITEITKWRPHVSILVIKQIFLGHFLIYNP